MKTLMSTLVALAVLAALAAPASATFTGSKNARDIFKKMEQAGP